MRTTAELVLRLLPEWEFHRELDPATGCAELLIRPARSEMPATSAQPAVAP